MAFVHANLERVSGGKQKTFNYEAGADAVVTVIASGYFNEAAPEFNKGDIIVAKCANFTAVDVLMVSSVRGVVPVTVVNGT